MFQTKDAPSGDSAWYLIHCQPRKERYAAQALEILMGLSTFLPEYKMRSRNRMRSVPFFPGYLFVQADLQQIPLSQINTTPGVNRLVAFGDDPQPVPPRVIEMISERLEQFDPLKLSSFQPGDVVQVKQEGPLQNLEMLFVGPSAPGYRVTVLLRFLGRLKEVQLDIGLLEKVYSPQFR